MCRLDSTRLHPARGLERWRALEIRGEWLGGRGETRTVEQHKLSMTYPIGASVTTAAAALPRCVVVGGSQEWGGAVRCGAMCDVRCDAMRCHCNGPRFANELTRGLGWAGLGWRDWIGLDWIGGEARRLIGVAKLQGEQASNWPKSRQEWRGLRVGLAGWRRRRRRGFGLGGSGRVGWELC